MNAWFKRTPVQANPSSAAILERLFAMFSRPTRTLVPPLEIATRTDRCLVAAVTIDTITHRQCEAVRSTAATLLDQTDSLVIDLHGIRHIDSAGLGAMVCIIKMAREAGKTASLCRLPSEVRVLVELVRLHELIDIYNTADEAIRVAEADDVDRVDVLLDSVQPLHEPAPEPVNVDLLESLR